MPTSAAKLKAFVDKTVKETGINIVYGDSCLERDNWALEILEDENYANSLEEIMKNNDCDLFEAVQTAYRTNKAWEDDH